MQLQQRDITNVRAGILQSQTFLLRWNGVLFRTTIDGIYSDKNRQNLRELCTNAWDASRGQRTGLWIKTDAKTCQAVLNYLGHPPNVVFIRDLPLPPKPPRAQRRYRVGGDDRGPRPPTVAETTTTTHLAVAGSSAWKVAHPRLATRNSTTSKYCLNCWKRPASRSTASTRSSELMQKRFSANPISTPIRRTWSGGCALAASDHAAAVPPSSVMNSRRRSGRDVHFMARPPPDPYVRLS